MIMFVAAMIIITGVVAWLLRRDIARAVRRRQWRAFTEATRGTAAAMGAALAPAMTSAVRAAADFEAAMSRVAETFGQSTLEHLAEVEEAMRLRERRPAVEYPALAWALREHVRVSTCGDVSDLSP